MTDEMLRPLNFYGSEVHPLLIDGWKLLTLRTPDQDKYGFVRGEKVIGNCVDSGVQVPLVVIDNNEGEILSLTPDELLLDGYAADGFLAEQYVRVDSEAAAIVAAQDLSQYYPGITPESVMQSIMTIPEEKFLALSPVVREDLMVRGGRGLMNDKDHPFKEIFFPAWFGWIVDKGGGINDWLNWLSWGDLIWYDELQYLNRYRRSDLASLSNASYDDLMMVRSAKNIRDLKQVEKRQRKNAEQLLDLYRTFVLLDFTSKSPKSNLNPGF